MSSKGKVMLKAADVLDVLESAKSAGQKAAATKLKKKYVAQQVALGKSEKGVETALKAVLVRRANASV